jgi:GAF domain-containing protein
MINRIAQAMHDTLVLDEVLQTTANQLHESLQVSQCLIFQPNASREMSSYYVSFATPDQEKLIGVSCGMFNYYKDTLAQGNQVVLCRIDQTLAPQRCSW